MWGYNMFELKPDYEIVLERYEAWWNCEIIDRPLVSIKYPKEKSKCIAIPFKSHTNLKEKWLDSEYQIEHTEAALRNQVFLADALPIAWPNLGPEIFSTFYGCDLEFGETTTWSIPVLNDWSKESLKKMVLNEESFYYKKVFEMSETFIKAAKGKYIVGFTDLHAGGDAIAALRDPENLLYDTIEHPNEIKSLCTKITNDFLKVYDKLYAMFESAGMPGTSWLPAICKGKFHIPQNDFSCMISKKSFEKLFVSEIIRECQHMDKCIYHLDGPHALRYLDMLLDIPEIHAIQWVPGASIDYWADWLHVYKRIQEKGKAMQILSMPVEDLHILFSNLKPEGVWISEITGITNYYEANAALNAISKWKV
jgi:hypothetical protein